MARRTRPVERLAATRSRKIYNYTGMIVPLMLYDGLQPSAAGVT
jgi:hypothetical protein